MRIIWDNEQTRVESGAYYLTIRTGMSVTARNVVQALRMAHSSEGAQLWADIMNAGATIPPLTEQDATAYPGIPELFPVTFDTSMGRKHFVYAFGVVPNGGRRGKQYTGEFRLVIVTADEIEAVLDSVFDLSRFIEKGLAA